jgi:hypothetical protein
MQLKAHLETVTTATKRWRAPTLGRSFDAWCKYVEAQENIEGGMSKQFDLRQLNNFELELLSAAETVQNIQSELTLQKDLNQHLEEQLQELQTEREVLEEANDGLTKELNAARSGDGEDKRTLAAAVVAEKKRRIQQAERTVQRILHSQLAGAFGTYHDRVVETKRKRETCRRTVLRMHEMGLGFAFDLFAGMVTNLKAHRLTVNRAVSRWRTSSLQIGFDSWLDCMDVTRNEVLEAACTQLTTEREVFEATKDDSTCNDHTLKDNPTTCNDHTLKDNPVCRCDLGCGFVGTVAVVTAHEQTCTQRWREREQEAKPEDAEKTREKLDAQLRKTSGDLQAMAAAEVQVQKDWIKFNVSPSQNSIRIVQSTHPGLNDRAVNYSSN